MAYNTTLSQRKSIANSLVAQRNSMINYRKNEAIRKEYERQQKALQQKKSNAGFFEKALDTVGDLSGQVFSGFAKGLEGIWDFGASIVGGVGGIFSDDFQNSVKEHISYDFTGEFVDSRVNEWFSDSYLNDGKVGRFIQNVANGVGQMLPAVIVGSFTAGAGSMATLGTSAMGNATESAFNEGASYGEGMLYGATNAMVEVATEKIGGKLFGNSVIDDALGLKPAEKTLFKAAKSKAGKVVQGAIGEGIEEGLAELANPLTKSIYQGKEALKEYGTKDYWGDVFESATVGAGTSLAFGGTVGQINKNTHNANDTLRELRTLDIKEDNLHAEGKLFEGGNEQKINNIRAELKAELSKDVSKMSEKTRAKYIEQNHLGDILNQDGSLKTTTTNSALDNATNSQNAENDLASQSNKEAYSPKFYGKEDSLLIKPTNQKLTQADRGNIVRVNKLNKGYNRVGVVIVDNGSIKNLTGQDSKAIEHNGVIYLEQDADVESSQKVLATHEMTHTLEGTKEKAKFDNFVIKSLLQDETLAKKFGSAHEKFAETLDRYRNVFAQKYGDVMQVTDEDLQKINDEISQETRNEVIAQYVSENFFTDEAVIERLALSNKSIFQKIYDWIKTKIERFKIKSAEDRKVFDFLHKAEGLYKKALENSRGGLGAVRYSIDNNEKTKYSIKKDNLGSYTEKQYNAYGWVRANDVVSARQWIDFNSKFQNMSAEVKNGKSSAGEYMIAVNDMIGNSFGVDNVIIFAKGTYQNPNITRIIKINLENETDIDIVRSEIYERERKRTRKSNIIENYYEPELVREYRLEDFINYQEHRTISERQYGKENKANDRKLQDRGRTTREVKYSLSKDSQGNTLTEKQEEFFKDSKVRDADGNLLVVYHGTKNPGFNVFKYDSNRQTGTDYGRAYYFTTNERNAKGYAHDVTKDKRISDYEDKRQELIQKFLNEPNIERKESLKQEFLNVKIDGKNLQELIDDIDYDTGGEIKKCYLNIKNPLVKDAKGKLHYEVYYDYFKEAREHNKDGIIVYNVDDSSKRNVGLSDVYIAFEENQIKLTSSKKPTLNKDIRFSLNKSQETALDKRGVKGYDFLNAIDLAEEILSVNGQITEDAKAVLYHATTKENAEKIIKSGKMYGKEPNLYFSTKPDGAILDYGKSVIQAEIPLEKLQANDLFSDELHLTMAVKPYELTNIRFALTKGQVAKDRANNTKMKVYSKIEAEKLINEIIDEKLNINDKFGILKGKSKEQAINQMFIALNSAEPGYRGGFARKIADYIIEHAIYEDMYEDELNQENLHRYNVLKGYKGKLNLSPIKSEIQHKYDTRPGNAIIMQWGTKSDGQSVDTIPQEIQEYGIQIESINEADIFFEMLDIYNGARDSLNKKAQKIRADYFESGELKTLRDELTREILKGYDKYGTASKFSNLVKRYIDRINLLKETIKDLKGRNKAINNLFATIDKVSGLEKFKGVDIELSNEVLGLIRELKKIKTYRGNLSKNVRNIMLKYSQEVDGKKLYDLIANNGDGIENPVAKMVEDIAHRNGELTTSEIKQLDEIMKNFIHNVKEYNRVFFEGKTQNDEAIVRQAIKETREAVALKTNGFLGTMSKFTRWLTAPVWRFERLSSYRQDGIMTKMFGELQQGVDNQARFNMNVAEHFKKFFKENKKTVSDWNKQTFDLNGVKLSRGQVITLYMLFQRKQAVGHLLSEDGITGTIRIVNEKHASKGNFKDALAEGVDVQIDYSTLDKIKESLTDVEKDFIKLSKEFFDKIARDAKYETDMALYGISNVGEENYIPIRVADDQIYKQLGGNEVSFSELFSVYNASFNKETKPNAKNKIVVENILDVINRHSKQMASYYGLAVPLKTLNRLYNKKLEDGSKLGIEINKVDPEFERYISKLLGDLQGRGKVQDGLEKVVNNFIGKIRGLGAKAALGLNLKVLANQFVSLPASHAIGVEYKNIMKGFAQASARKTNFDKLTQYCPMLYDRFREGSNIDVGLLKEGQGVFGKIDKLTELTTAPIGKIDKFICGAVWNACLEQTKSNNYEDFSDEHYKEAAKLTEKAVIKTQANYTALYRPELLRTQSSLVQLSTMFMSEPLQQLSLLASSIDKIYVAKKLIKQNNSAENRALLKQARSEAFTAVTAVMVDAILLTLIAQAFKWVKGQDDEEVLTSMTKELTSNFIGMFPVIKDIYSYLEGYDITNMAYTGLTNVVNAFQEMVNIFDLIASGKQYSEIEIRGKLRKVLMGLSQTFGIPLRNLETYSKGIIEKFSPSFIYWYDSRFYNNSMSNYSKELKQAIEDGDDKLADTIIDVMLADEKVEVKDEKIRKVMKDLYEEGFDIFPKSVGKTIIHDSESINLTKRQHEKFINIYSEANDKVSSLINSKSFEDKPSIVKAKSIKYIYDYYYEEALKDLLGIDSDEKKYLFAQSIDITKLAMVVSEISQIVADTDESGKSIAGSRKSKIVNLINSMNLTATQKYMLMGYFGYKNTNGERQVKTYIQSLKLTKTEKETLFKMCGYGE